MLATSQQILADPPISSQSNKAERHKTDILWASHYWNCFYYPQYLNFITYNDGIQVSLGI